MNIPVAYHKIEQGHLLSDVKHHPEATFIVNPKYFPDIDNLIEKYSNIIKIIVNESFNINNIIKKFSGDVFDSNIIIEESRQIYNHKRCESYCNKDGSTVDFEYANYIGIIKERETNSITESMFSILTTYNGDYAIYNEYLFYRGIDSGYIVDISKILTK